MDKKIKSGKSEEKYLTAQEAANYAGFKISYFYKLTSGHRLPFYNPTGRKILVKRSELDAWIESSRISTDDEIEKRIERQKMLEG